MKAHDYAGIFPMLPDDKLKELADDIRANGLQEPILKYNGEILDGRNRLRACEMAGVQARFEDAPCRTDEEAVALVMSLNLHRRHLDASQRSVVAARVQPFYEAITAEKRSRAVAAANVARWAPAPEQPVLVRGNPSLAPPAKEPEIPIKANLPELGRKPPAPQARDMAAAALNVSARSVQAAKKVIEEAEPEVVAAIDAGALPVSAAVHAIEMQPEEQREVARLVMSGEAKTGADAIRQVKKPHVVNNSGENEWYTPPAYLAAARATLGSIDLDPSSCEIANANVQAAKYFTQEDDGLAQEWAGRVWMNPPYERGLVDKFAQKLVESFEDGKVTGAVVLVNNATETQWFARMADVATGLCFPTGRVRFLSPQGEKGAPLQGQAVIYMGDDFAAFYGAFRGFGIVAEVKHGRDDV